MRNSVTMFSTLCDKINQEPKTTTILLCEYCIRPLRVRSLLYTTKGLCVMAIWHATGLRYIEMLLMAYNTFSIWTADFIHHNYYHYKKAGRFLESVCVYINIMLVTCHEIALTKYSRAYLWGCAVQKQRHIYIWSIDTFIRP